MNEELNVKTFPYFWYTLGQSIISTLAVLLIIFSVFLIIWGFHIVKLQINFTDKCIRYCLDRNITDCYTTFDSYPWSYVNGKCIHKRILEIIE